MHILAAAGARIFLHKGMGIISPGFHLGAGVAAGILVPLMIRAGIKRSGWRFFYRPIGLING